MCCHNLLVSRSRSHERLEGYLHLWPAVYAHTYSYRNPDGNCECNCNSDFNPHVDAYSKFYADYNSDSKF